MSPISPRPTRRRSAGFFARRLAGSLIAVCGCLIFVAEAARSLGATA